MSRTLLDSLQASLGASAQAILPELVLCGAIVLMLLVRLFPRFDRRHLGVIALVLCLYALVVSLSQWLGSDEYDPRGAPSGSLVLFGGMLVHDNFAVFVKIFLLGFTALVIMLN